MTNGTGRLAGKVAIITGAARSGGIGAATARLFIQEGARVVLGDIRAEEGRATAAALGPNALFCEADVTSGADWQRIVATAHRFGPVSVLVNNAGQLLIAKILQTREPDIERLFRVNQLGPMLGMQAVLPEMIKAGAGSIVNVASADGLIGQDMGISAYSATKWALRGITKTVAMEVGRYGVRVNCVHPNGGNPEFAGPFLPKGMDARKAQVEHQHTILEPPRGFPRHDAVQASASMILFLASDESLHCTGGDFPVDGGHTAGHRLDIEFAPPT
jgi:3alpha(or 20beta)-hydroxysteroid dehydrogenase